MLDRSEKILNFLKKKDWTIVGEIVSELNDTRAAVKSELTYLFHKGLVERQKTQVIKGRGYIWKYKKQNLKQK